MFNRIINGFAILGLLAGLGLVTLASSSDANAQMWQHYKRTCGNPCR
jgi:hypothetical protein